MAAMPGLQAAMIDPLPQFTTYAPYRPLPSCPGSHPAPLLASSKLSLTYSSWVHHGRLTTHATLAWPPFGRARATVEAWRWRGQQVEHAIIDLAASAMSVIRKAAG